MQEDNPYATPTACDPDPVVVFSGNHWRVYADTVIARHGATLPMVDLETGETGQGLRAIHHASGLFKSWRPFVSASGRSVLSFAGRRTRIARIRREVLSKIIDLAILAMIILPNSRSEGFVVLLIGMILVNFGKSRLKIEPSAKAGWLRITGAHPSALDYLRAMARPQTHQPAGPA